MAFKRDKQQIQDILTLIEQYDEALSEIASEPARQQESAAEAIRRLSERELSNILRGMDVETEEAVDFLREAGCGRLQGYFYGKPMRYEELLEKINDGTLKLSEKHI